MEEPCVVCSEREGSKCWACEACGTALHVDPRCYFAYYRTSEPCPCVGERARAALAASFALLSSPTSVLLPPEFRHLWPYMHCVGTAFVLVALAQCRRARPAHGATLAAAAWTTGALAAEAWVGDAWLVAGTVVYGGGFFVVVCWLAFCTALVFLGDAKLAQAIHDRMFFGMLT